MNRRILDSLRNNFLKLYDCGDFQEAAQTGEKLIKLHEFWKTEDTLFYADDAYNLACVYAEHRYSPKIARALELFKKAAKTVKNIKGENFEYTAILNNLAITLIDASEFEEAVKYFKEICGIRKGLLSENNTSYLNALTNLGNALFYKGDYDESVKYHQKALSLRKKKDFDYAYNLNFIAYSYEAKKDYEKACEYLSDAVEIIGKVKGKLSEEYMKNVYYLALICDKAGIFTEARFNYERCIGLIREYVGENHILYSKTLDKLSDSYFNLRNYNSALVLRTKSLNIVKNIFTENNVYYASSLKKIGDIYVKKYEFYKAIEAYKKSLSIKINILGKEHFDCIEHAAILGRTYLYISDFEKAREIISPLIELIKYEDNKELYISLLIDLAFIYIKSQDILKLYSVYKELGRIEPSLSFDEMLKDIKEFAVNMEIPVEELEKIMVNKPAQKPNEDAQTS